MIEQLVSEILKKIVKGLGFEYPSGVIIGEPPAAIEFDLSVNLAMQLARQSKGEPRLIAEQIKNALEKYPEIVNIEIAGPGFLNIILNNLVYENLISKDFLLKKAKTGERVVVEYISGNPTGPLHIGNARGGPIGETICRVLESQGIEVAREFYVNNLGNQANIFGLSVLHFYRLHYGVESNFPEKGYPGEYVRELAVEIAQAEGRALLDLPEPELEEKIRQLSLACIIKKIQATCQRMGIHFDHWVLQSSLPESGLSNEILQKLVQSGATMEKDGALWLKEGVMKDDRETVLVKSNGTTTYFLDDLAYHWQKLELRRFDRAIVLLGANHFGHIPRMKAGIKVLGIDPERYVGVMYQNVQLVKDGVAIKMAKREGNFVTADEVLDEVPLDVFNYFILSKSNESHLEFDLQLAKDTSEKNPIYYIQYAYARIHSLLSMAAEKNIHPSDKPGSCMTKYEKELLLHIDRYAGCLSEIAISFQTHLLPAYLYELATRFHALYAHQRFLTEDLADSSQALFFAEKTALVIKDGLDLLNITAEERM